MELEELFGHLLTQAEVSNGKSENTTFNFTWMDTNYIGMYPGLTIPYLVVLCVLMVVGTVGNILVIGAVCVSNRLRTTGNMFIVNLAVTDLFMTAFIDPFNVISVILGPEYFMDKASLCIVVAAVCLPSCVCSLWTMGAIAINRYIFLCHNHVYERIFSKKKSLFICLVLWAFSYLVMEFPVQFGWGGHTFDTKKMMCTYNRLASYSHVVFFCSFAIGLPLVVVSCFYLKIYLYVRDTKQVLEKVASRDKLKPPAGKKLTASTPKISTHMDVIITSRKREAIQLAKTLFTVFIVFFICWTPYALVILSDPLDEWSMAAYSITILLGHANASLNSIIYAASNRQFRKGYIQFICCRSPVKRCFNFPFQFGKDVQEESRKLKGAVKISIATDKTIYQNMRLSL